MYKSAFLPVEDFANAICPINAQPRILVMFTAYFDASRTQDGRPYVAVSGCLASEAKWKLFQHAWQIILEREDLPFFHMTDFEAYQTNYYRDWSKERHNSVLTDLASIMIPNTDFAFGRGVAIDDWEHAQTQNEALKSWSAFSYCANQCLHAIAIWANEHNHTGPIIYVFESGDGYDGELLARKKEIESSRTSMMRFRWGGLHIMPKRADAPFPLTPLQAADIWAFETRKEWENKYAVGKEERLRPLRYSARLLLGSGTIKYDFGFSARENLLNLEPYWLTRQE